MTRARAAGLTLLAAAGVSAAAGCGASRHSPDPPGRTVAALVSRGKGARLVVVAVQIAGKAYGFVVDTGASQTSLDLSVARRLHLAPAGRNQTQTTVGCSSSSQPVRIRRWSLDGVRLPSTVATAETTDLAAQTKGKIVGLLGSDVLGHFGRVTIDYRRSALTLGGPAPFGGRSFPAKIVRAAGQTLVATRIVVRGRPLAYLVDTGAGTSTIDARIAARLRLPRAGRPRGVSAVSCETRVQPVRIDRWAAGSVTLPEATAASQRSQLTDRFKIAGLLGGNVLAHFGRVSIDYGTGRVTLGGHGAP